MIKSLGHQDILILQSNRLRYELRFNQSRGLHWLCIGGSFEEEDRVFGKQVMQ